MNLTSCIIVQDDGLYECVKSEQKDMPRSSLKIKKQKKNVVFDIKADDATALRATLNTVLKLLIVYEKSGKIR